MFWRFGFHNASSIDSLLDKDDVALEAILNEDDLLQECKAQNTRLIDYLQRVDVLQRLLGYVTGQIEGEEAGRFKYPYVATEVLCSEIWSIVETCVNNAEQLLGPFWENVLDRSPDDMKTQMVMAAHFAKINAVFLSKKPAEMLAFIQSQPNVVERMLKHIDTPSFVDLLVRVIQLDEHPGGAGVLEWLGKENLMQRLIDLLSPNEGSDLHAVVAELIKGIISMAAPSPGAGLTEGLQNGPASNRFARELAHRTSVTKLMGYMLQDFRMEEDAFKFTDSNDASGLDASVPIDLTPPNSYTKTSSVVHSIGVIIELIRKNNSDYFEPYLFHTLRNRLIQVQQHLTPQEGRENLEQAMKDMVDRMGVVHLGPVLETMCANLDSFQAYLRKPRSTNGPAPTTVGPIEPLSFERYRICELYAELLHCSNMSLLNRAPEFSSLYDSEGRLQGGLHSLEELARVIAIGSGEDRDHEAMDEANDDIEPALELPVTTSSHDSSSLIDSDEDMSDDEPGSDEDDAMEEIAMYDEPAPAHSRSPASSIDEPPLQQPPIIVPSSPNTAGLPSPSQIAAQGAALSQRVTDPETSTIGHRSHGSRRNSRRVSTFQSVPDAPLPIGEMLKKQFLDLNVMSTLLDLFFEFPWNNFLHSVVYDVVHQVLTGRVDGGVNRELTISLFRDARLMYRIVEGQKRNDVETEKPKGVRLGFMGHITLITEDVVGALEHYPLDLRVIIASHAPRPDWEDYINGRYMETKRRDTTLLGGGKPVLAPGINRNAGRWKVDEEDAKTAAASASNEATALSEPKGEFRRAGSARPTRESSADFGPAPMEDDEDDEDTPSPPQFARYLAEEMHSSDNFGSTSSDASDDEDEDGGWLAQSTFDLGNPPATSLRERRPLSNGFDDAFVPSHVTNGRMSGDPFGASDEDDGTFGPFSDSAAASGADPFTFGSNFSEEIDDTSFDGFGDFGDFQSAHDGELTPTTGSWTFTSGSSASDEAEDSDPAPEHLEHVSLDEKRTALDIPRS